MKPAPTNAQADTGKLEKPFAAKPQDFLKLIEELRALKSRSHTLDLQRLEEAHRQGVDGALKAAEKRFKPGGPDNLQKLQAEERRIADSKFEQDKNLLAAKYQKLDAGLLALSQFLSVLTPVKELEAALEEKSVALRKAEEELNVQRKVFAHEQDELEREKKLLDAAEEAVKAKERDLEAKLSNVDVVRRARELDQTKKELDAKVAALKEQEQRLAKERADLHQELEKLGRERAEQEREEERLARLAASLSEEKAKMADAVAREMAATFEAFVRGVLKPSGPKAAP